VSGDTTYQALKRLSWLPDRDSGDNGSVIAGQDYTDVEFIGGAISNVTLTDVTVNGTETARNERVITAGGNVTVASDDYIITMAKTVGQITTITLPASPTESRSLIIKDDNGDAATYNITVDGNGKDIDGAGTFVMNVNYQAIEIVYNGTQWNLIGEYIQSGDGSVTSISIASANGFSGTSDGDPSTPQLTISTTIGSGNIPVSNGTGFQAAPLTGTGNIVLATSPTLTTPNLGTPSAVVLTNATGTASGLTAGAATTATVASTVSTADEATDTTCFPLFVTASGTQSLQPKNNASLTFNSNTGALGATTLGGTLTTAAQTNITSVGTLSSLTLAGTLAMGANNITITGSLAATGSRVTKGWFTDIESTNAPTVGGTALPTATSTTTLTNKRVTPRVSSTASSATPTPNADTDDEYIVTSLAESATFGAPTGTPTQGQALIIRIKDNGTGRTLAFNAIYRGIGVSLPSTTTSSKTMYMGMIYNSTDTKWDVTGVSEEA
jgi:hypothetical protein